MYLVMEVQNEMRFMLQRMLQALNRTKASGFRAGGERNIRFPFNASLVLCLYCTFLNIKELDLEHSISPLEKNKELPQTKDDGTRR